MDVTKRTLILGLGNALMSDNGVGVYVARRLKNLMDLRGVSIEESDLSGFDLLKLIDGFDEVIIIDAVDTRGGVPGNIYRFDLSEPESCKNHPDTAHLDIDLLRDRDGMENIYVPGKIILYAVEAEDLHSFGKGCTEEVDRSIPRVTKLIMDEMHKEFSTH